MTTYVQMLILGGDQLRNQLEILMDGSDGFVIDAFSGPTEGEGQFRVDLTVANESVMSAIDRALKVLQIKDEDRVLSIRSRTGEQLDREHLEEELLGVKELAAKLNVTPQRVSAMSRKLGSFPTPWAVLAAGPIWRRSEIEDFVERWPRKAGRPSAGRIVADGAAAAVGLTAVALKSVSNAAKTLV